MMPQFNRRELDERSRQYGFNRDTFEKVLRLKIILEYFNSQDYLKEHLLLKGGTAINLTIFNLPRLSVDIDLVRRFFFTFMPAITSGNFLKN
jgi:predicted nucleotidyltransferase component of viral defense system